MQVISQIWQLLKTLGQFALANPEFCAPPILGALSLILGFLYKRFISKIGRSNQKKLILSSIVDSDTSPFEKIAPYSHNVLWRLLSHLSFEQINDPLADHNIPYQTRVSGRNIQREIINLLEQGENPEQQWVLILGRSGLGKSREAAQVAQVLNNDGWTVLKLKTMGWEIFSRPNVKVLEEFGDQKLLFFLDDVNRIISLEPRRLRLRGLEEKTQLAEVHPLEQLLEVLNTFERSCRPKNVRVLATARNEPVPEKEGDLSELQKLGLDEFAIWKRFHYYELPDPDIEALVNLQREGSDVANLQADPNQFQRLAQKSDRTMQVFVNNLREARREKLPLEQVSEENLQNSWRSLYQRAKAQYKATPHIYAAIILLQSLGVVLHATTVIPTAQMIASKGKLAVYKWVYYWHIQQAFKYLSRTESTSILNPKDGQLEASSIIVDPVEYISPILKLLLILSKKAPSIKIMFSLYEFGAHIYEMGRYQQALVSFRKIVDLPISKILEKSIDNANTDSQVHQFTVSFLGSTYLLKGNCYYFLNQKLEAIESYNKALKIKPDYYKAMYNRGLALFKLERKKEAIESYDEALEFNPDLYEAWYIRGLVLADLGRNEEAIASYNKAIKIKPDDHDAWYNRGLVLADLGRNKEAIASYDEAIKIKPDDHDAWYNRGLALAVLGRNEEAIASYDEAIKIKPDDHDAWCNQGFALNELGRKKEAIASYDKALEIKPDDHYAWILRGLTLFSLGRNEEAITSCDEALLIKPDSPWAWYGRGLALSTSGRNEEAIASFDKALAFKLDDHDAWYNRGNALDALGRKEEAIASYDKALEFKPNYHEAWYNRGLVLDDLGRNEEAIASYDKALEFKPDNASAYFNKARCYTLLGNAENAIQSLQKAINLDPECREDAKTDTDFDSIREDERFRALVEAEE